MDNDSIIVISVTLFLTGIALLSIAPISGVILSIGGCFSYFTISK